MLISRASARERSAIVLAEASALSNNSMAAMSRCIKKGDCIFFIPPTCTSFFFLQNSKNKKFVNHTPPKFSSKNGRRSRQEASIGTEEAEGKVRQGAFSVLGSTLRSCAAAAIDEYRVLQC
jgi:hypothetical protein